MTDNEHDKLWDDYSKLIDNQSPCIYGIYRVYFNDKHVLDSEMCYLDERYLDDYFKEKLFELLVNETNECKVRIDFVSILAGYNFIIPKVRRFTYVPNELFIRNYI